MTGLRLVESEQPDEPDYDADPFDVERRSAITSTDIAPILGLSRFGTPLSVYRKKVGLPDTRQPTLRAWVGGRLEDLVAELCMTATGWRLRADNGFYRHGQYHWLGTHLDRRVIGSPRTVVELKTRGSTRGWGPDGTAEVPVDVWCQVQGQMIVLDIPEVYVACLFTTSDYRTYRVPFDPVFAETLIPRLEQFWFEHVVARVEPPSSGRPIDNDIVKTLDGGAKDGPLKQATPTQETIVQSLRLARAETARAAIEQAAIEDRIKQIIDDDAGLVGSFGTITWRRNKDSVQIAYDLVAAAYRRLLDDVRPGLDDRLRPLIEPESLDAVVSLYTSVRPGARTFLVKFTEE